MHRFRAFMARLMYGRYGVDRLYTGLFVLFLIIALINLFVPVAWLSLILSLLNLIIVFFMFYRVFSKKIYKRKREETIYLIFINKFKRPFVVARKKFKDRKTHVYKKCPTCKTQLRFPKKKATIVVTCPKCKNSFKIKMK